MIDGVTAVGKVADSVRNQIEATIAGTGVRSGQRRLDPTGQAGTVNVLLAKSDGAALGVYGIAVQRVTKDGVEPWHVEVFDNPDGDDTRRSIMKLLGRELNKAITEQFKANADNPAPIHVVVPDSTTADILVSIADSVAGKELSRLRWERDKQRGRPALTNNGEPAVVPSRLPEKDRVGHCCVERWGLARDWSDDLVFTFGVRWLSVPSRGDLGRGAVVLALRAVLS